MPNTPVRLLLVALLAVVPGSQQLNAAENEPPHAKPSFEHGREGIEGFLRGFVPDGRRRRQTEELIARLDDDLFEVRQQAMHDLVRIPMIAPQLLSDVARTGSTELRWAVRRLRAIQSPERIERLLRDSFAFIVERREQGLCAEVMAALSHVSDPQAIDTGKLALRVTSTATDERLLREALQHVSPTVRAAAVETLADVLGSPSIEAIEGMLDDEAADVRLAAALALGNLGSRECLPALVELLDHEQLLVRWRSAEALQSLTGNTVPYRPTSNGTDRRRSIEKWRSWMESQGQSCRLQGPIEMASDIALFNGRDLGGWLAFSQGQQIDPDHSWQVDEGVLATKGSQHGYLRTVDEFDSYRLSLEWRAPRGVADGGIGIMMSGEDAPEPAYLEIQLHTDNAGDLYTVGDFVAFSRGQKIGFRAPKALRSNEAHGGAWNRVEITVQDGSVRVEVNGLPQNQATDCSAQPGKILLRHEGSLVEYRDIRLAPL